MSADQLETQDLGARSPGVPESVAFANAAFATGLALGALSLGWVLLRMTGQHNLALSLVAIAISVVVGLRVARRNSELDSSAGLTVGLLVLLSIVVFGAFSLLAVMLALVHGALFARRRDPALGLLLLSMGPLEANLALVSEPNLVTLALVAVQLLISVGLLALLHRSVLIGRAPRSTLRARWVERASRQPFRPGAALRVSAAVLLLAVAVQILGASLSQLFSGSESSFDQRDPFQSAGTTGGGNSAPGSDPLTRFPEGVDLSASAPSTSATAVVEVSGAAALDRPVWLLRALVFDRISHQGIESSALGSERLVLAGEDGLADGWVRREGATPGQRYLSLRVWPLELGASQTQPLLRPAEWSAIEMERVLWHPDGILTTVGKQAGARFRLELADPQFLGPSTATRPLSSADWERFTALPEPISASQRAFSRRIAGLSRRALGQVPRPELAVVQLLEAFSTDKRYRYELRSSGDSGFERLDRFLTQREGSCTHFATSAVWLLREAKIPARVVAGFRAATWNSEGVCVARSSDAHVWCELWLDGRGWVEFDPTPGGGNGTGETSVAGAAAEDQIEGPEALVDEQPPARSPLERFQKDARFGFGELIAGLVSKGPFGRMLGWLAGLVFLGLLLRWVRARVRMRRESGAAEPGAAEDPAGRAERVGGLLGQILGVLANLGVPRPAAATPVEWVRLLRSRLVGDEGRLEGLLERAYGERYGSEEPLNGPGLEQAMSTLAALGVKSPEGQAGPPGDSVGPGLSLIHISEPTRPY